MFHWSVRSVGDVRRGLDSIRTRADRAQAARLEGWLGAVLADRSDRSPGFDLDCVLPAARIRTNPVSLNGGVERAPPAR